ALFFAPQRPARIEFHTHALSARMLHAPREPDVPAALADQCPAFFDRKHAHTLIVWRPQLICASAFAQNSDQTAEIEILVLPRQANPGALHSQVVLVNRASVR